MPESSTPATVSDASNPALLLVTEHEAPAKSFARQCFDYARGELGKHPQVELTASASATVIAGFLFGVIAGTKWSSLLWGLGAGVLSGIVTLVFVWLVIFLIHLKRAPATLFRQKQDEILGLHSLVAELRKANEAKADNANILKNLVALHAQGSIILHNLKAGSNLRQGQVSDWYQRTVNYLEERKGESYAQEFLSLRDALPPGETCPDSTASLCAVVAPRLDLLMGYIRAWRD